MFANWTYYLPSTTGGDLSPNGTAQSFAEEYWNVSAGITFYTSCFCLPMLMHSPDNGNFAVQAPVGDH